MGMLARQDWIRILFASEERSFPQSKVVGLLSLVSQSAMEYLGIS
jgi:hypothetical protein